MRRLSTLGVLALVVAAGCDEGRTTVLEPFGAIGIGSAVGPAAARVPTGTVSYRIVTTIDTTTTPDDTLSVDSIMTVQVANLRAYGSAGYQLWITTIDTVTGLASFAAPTGRLVERFLRDSLVGGVPFPDPVSGDIVRVVDSTVISPTGQFYAGSDDPDVFAATYEMRPAGQPVDPFTAHAISFSMEPAAGTAPTGTHVLWRRVGLGIGAAGPTTVVFPNLPDSAIRIRTTSRTGGGTLSFGVYSGPDEAALVSPADYAFTAGGTGTILFRGPEVVADLRELPRPPLGFFYRGYLVDTAGTMVLVDTLRSAHSPLEDQSRVSMFDADVNGLLPGISVTSITRSQIRNCAGTAVAGCRNTLGLTAAATGTFAGQEVFIVTLDPKGASANFGVTVLLAAAIPDRVWEN